MEITLPHNEGWNLVGLPLDTTPFPCNGYIDGSLYSFETGSYLNISTDEMAIGSGYWLRFEEEDECTFSGVPIDNITVSLNEGWNLISGISTSVAINTIIDLNELIVPGTIYGFDGSYIEAEFLDPGSGYWLRSTGEGEVTLSSSAPLTKSRFFQPPEHLSAMVDASTLTIGGVVLYFGTNIPDKDLLSYSLPPKPPTGAFDVRFIDGWRVVKDYGEVEVMPTTETLTIAYNIMHNAGELHNWVLTATSGEKYILESTGELTVPSAERFTLELKAVVPATFTLHQNFPNPFNPITTLRYDLPSNALVTLSIYDMLGREVTQLINTTQEAGYRLVQWDATDMHGKPVSAGVYLYQIRAGEFAQTKKMVLLK
jgi:hypothetical protein